MKRAALLLAVLSLFGILALADESHHHEDLTAEQLGTVHFHGFLYCVLAEGI